MRPTVDLLHEIPDLAAEVAATALIGAPNPGTEPTSTSRSKPGSRPPLDLAALTALRADNHGLLAHLEQCTRAVTEERGPHGLPDRDPTTTWTSECDWLLATTHLWQTDPWLNDWITSQVTDIHHQLAQLARVHTEPAYRCPRCGDSMRLQDGGKWLRCDSGHEQEADLEARYRRRAAMPGSLCAAEFGLSEDTIATWRKRRRLHSVKHEGGKHWYLPWDVLLLAHPSIADAVARRESA